MLTGNAAEQAVDAAEWPAVAIVVVNYRSTDDTLVCVESLFGLDYPHLTIVVVDNASDDGSVQRFQSAWAGDCRVKVLTAAVNRGYTGGNNIGLRWAVEHGFPFVHVLNPDTTVLAHDYLRQLVRFALMNPEMGAIGPRVHFRRAGVIQNTVLVYPWLSRRLYGRLAACLGWSLRRSGDNMVLAETLNGVCVLFRTDALRATGYFDERLFAYIEDHDWSLRARAKGWLSAYLPVDAIVHHQQPGRYGRLGNVDYLLKRNTLFLLLRTGRRFQAAIYSVATLVIGLLAAMRHGSRGRTTSIAAWRKLAATYVAIWTGQESAVMGRPH